MGKNEYDRTKILSIANKPLGINITSLNLIIKNKTKSTLIVINTMAINIKLQQLFLFTR